MTRNAFSMTFAATFPKVSLFANTFCENLQSANAHAHVLSLSPKYVSGNEILFGKADLSAFSMIPKLAVIEKVDDDDNNTDFELAFCIRVVFAGNNKNYQLVKGRNIAEPPSE